ncbi:hypothetical protein [Pseudomonas maumuensis]|uniref:Uncharacterized protein n=1 Tax=Pseudomonas maumuensis TaxID=2842354 RepID=A0ABX8NE84_9PSED|nr:hypothetical protein [Pseudomonas maumuensis]QXH54666.1 hypothetical protein KSS90_14970 [Pseudomonas maumuensis]
MWDDLPAGWKTNGDSLETRLSLRFLVSAIALANVLTAVGYDDARLTVDDHAATDLGGHTVVAADVVTVVVAYGFLHACAALRAGGGMVVFSE